MNLSIKNKILFGLFLIVFLFTLASYMVTLRINSIKSELKSINSVYLPIAREITQLKTIDKSRGLVNLVSFSEVDFRDSFQHFSRFMRKDDSVYILKSIGEHIKNKNTKINSATLNKKINSIEIALIKYNSFSINAHKLLQQQKITLNDAIIKFKNLRSSLNRKIYLFERFIDRKLKVGLLTTENNGQDIILSLTIFMAIMSAVSLIIFLLVRSSLSPLDELYKGVKKLAAGDYSYKITFKKNFFFNFLNKIFPTHEYDSEIKLLGHQFNLMSQSILERTKELRRSEQLAAIGKITSEITHEIRNPLNSINLNLSLLEDEIKDNREALGLLSSINIELKRLSNVTQSYLDYIKPVSITLSDTSINEIIWGVYDLFKNELNSKNIKISINIPSEDIILKLDKEMIKRLLINLVKNSIEALSTIKSDNKLISINLIKLNNKYKLIVNDNGPGINEEDQDKIFLPFFSRKKGGTGLGLGISYEISRKHDTTLICSSKEGHSTSFSVEFKA